LPRVGTPSQVNARPRYVASPLAARVYSPPREARLGGPERAKPPADGTGSARGKKSVRLRRNGSTSRSSLPLREYEARSPLSWDSLCAFSSALRPLRPLLRRATYLPHRLGRRTSRVASVSVQPDGVINIIPASPYGRTCSGHDRGGRSPARTRQTSIPVVSLSAAKPIKARSSRSVTRRWSSG